MKLVTWAGASLMMVLAELAGAQAYPNKPIRLVVPFPAGGGADFVGTTIEKKLSEALRQPVVLEHRPGAAGVAGVQLIAKATPDGYSLLVGGLSTMSVQPVTNVKLPYDPIRDFAPISRLVVNPLMLVVHPSLPVNSVKKLVALAKSKPGQITYGSTGYGGTQHLAMEWLRVATGINVVHFPFDGGAPARAALFAGEISAYFSGVPGALPHVKTGKLKALAVTSSKRWSELPNVPTVDESGVPGFECVVWYGLFAPAKTPKDIVGTLNAEVVKVLEHPETVRQFTVRGAEPTPSTPEGLGKYLREDHERWKKVVKNAGIKLK